MAYFASPKDSDRARRFREAWNNATPGQNFMFEGQPYAGPEGLPPNQQVQQYAQSPPGGWTGGVDPNVALAQNQILGVSPSINDLERMGGPEFKGKDSDYYAQNFFREHPINPLTGEPDYSPEIGPEARNMGLMESTETHNFGDWVADPSTAPAGYSIPFPEQSQEQLASAMYRVDDPSNPKFSSRHIFDPSPRPSSVTGMYAQSGGEGLLSESDYKLYDWLDNPTPIKQETPGLLADNSDTDKPGWEKDKKFNDALLQMVMQWGMNQATDDEF